MKASNQIKFIKDRHINGLEVCSVNNSSHVFPKHSHEKVYAISLMEQGGSYWNGSDKSKSLVEPGNIAVINPDQLHSGEPVKSKRTSYKMIYLDVSHFYEKKTIPLFENIIRESPELSLNFRSLYNLIISDSEVLEKEIQLASFTELMMNKHSSPALLPEKTGKEKNTIRIAEEYLSENLDRKITLSELSRLTGFSTYHFLRIFKKDTGVTPHTYRTQKRINRAKELILNGLALSEIAFLTGFSDQSHLTNTFRNYTGATPGQYFLNK